MQSQAIRPDRRYSTRMRLVITIVALAVLLGSLLLALIIEQDRQASSPGIPLTVVIPVAVVSAAWLLAMLLAGPYYRSLRYEIEADEVVVRAGIWTKSVKHVPYRTVTNITVKRDVLDRLLGLGTLNIQTAGMSGTKGAEESLVGLGDVAEAYTNVAQELRRFRVAMSPTQTEMESVGSEGQDFSLGAILTEIRAIRQTLEARS
ncbi:MAG: PH domain-containing protein [Anaerolineae bacterium]